MAVNQVFIQTQTTNLVAGNTYRLQCNVKVLDDTDLPNLIRAYPNISGKIFTEFNLISIVDSSSPKNEKISLEVTYKATTNESVNLGFVVETNSSSDLIDIVVDDFLVTEDTPLQPEQFNNSNVYDLTITQYGNILGLAEFIGQLNSINVPVTEDVTFPEKVFSKFIPKQQISTFKPKFNYIVRKNTSIYDIALQIGGKVEDIDKVLDNFTSLDDDIAGTSISVERSNDPIFTELNRRKIFISTAVDAVIIEWILANGIWNDLGVWRDTENWQDS